MQSASIGQQQTFEATVEAFQKYIVKSFNQDIQLYKILPSRTLLMIKYQILSNPNVHVDAFGVIKIHGKEFKVAIEHQGSQHYSFAAFLQLVQRRDIKIGVFKSVSDYKKMFDGQIARDRAKVQLFKDLNKNGYFLIVVPYTVPLSDRQDFILKEFIRQAKVDPSQPSIADYI